MSHGPSSSLSSSMVDPGQGSGSRVPVFVFPASLSFYADDQTSQKQVLTLYNPYDFALRFKVFSTAPRKYVVMDAEGTIKPRCCIDIVIRHNAILACNFGVVDKFRIQMQEHGRRTVIGKKDVTATLFPSKPDVGIGQSGSLGEAAEHFEQLLSPSTTASQGHHRAQQYSIGGGLHQRQQHDGGAGGGSGPSLIVVLAAVVCILALLLPTEGQADRSSLPSYLHLSLPQKLIFAYALGLVTMVILKT